MQILYINFNIDLIFEILTIILYYSTSHSSLSLELLLWLFSFLGHTYDALFHSFSHLTAYRSHLQPPPFPHF
jgi:hypothetical protein